MTEPPRCHDGKLSTMAEKTEKTEKTMTVRLARELSDTVEAVAQVQGTSVTDLIRRAISDYVERCISDGAFQEAMEASLQAHRRKLLEGLGFESRGKGKITRRPV
jgi:predicted transcriptional regulator